jgi:hypothetical protein
MQTSTKGESILQYNDDPTGTMPHQSGAVSINYQHVPFSSAIDVKNSKNKNQGGCRRNMRIILVIIGIFLLFLSVLGATVFFLFPRIPRVDVVSADVVTGITLKITSASYVNYTVKSIKGQGTFQGDTLATIDKGSFVIKAGDETTVQIPVHVSKPFPKSAFEKCLSDSAVPIEVMCEIDLKIISWTGKKISIKRAMMAPCPEATQRARAMLQEKGLTLDEVRKYGDPVELARSYGYL